MTEPTDAEIVAVMRDGYNCRYNDEQDHIDFARAVLAKCGTPTAAVAGEPVAWLSTDCIGERYLCFTKPNDSDSARPLVFGDAAPQPTQAQAGAAPLTDEQVARIARSVLEAPAADGVAPAWALAEGIARAIEAAHGVGIKKGDSHGLPT